MAKVPRRGRLAAAFASSSDGDADRILSSDDDDDDDDCGASSGSSSSSSSNSSSGSGLDSDSESVSAEDIHAAADRLSRMRVERREREAAARGYAPHSFLNDAAADADAGAGIVDVPVEKRKKEKESLPLPRAKLSWGLFSSYLEPTLFIPYPETLVSQGLAPREAPSSGLTELSLRKGSIPRPRYKMYWERNACKDCLRAAGFDRTKSSRQWNVYWGKHIKNKKVLDSMNIYQRTNHFPGSWALGRKDRSQRLFERKRRRHRKAYDFFPEGFVLPKQRGQLVRSLKESSEKLWIRKPLASSQGRGIKVVDKRSVLKVADKRKCVIQKYIERPLLIDGKKFDIRVYVLVTSFAPLRAYMFREGLARFCTQKYARSSQSATGIANRYGHLTNYSINKKAEDFDDSEDDASGSKWSLSALLSHLETKGRDAAALIRRMRDVAVKTLIAGASEINYATSQKMNHKESCYELFGFDFLLDRKLKVWLLEVNVSPSLMGSSPMDSFIKGTLMCDVFHTIGIVPFNPKKANAEVAQVKNDRLRGTSSALRERRSRNVSQMKWAQLVKQDRKVVYHAIEEHHRCGHFERIFPPPNNAALHDSYLKLFDTVTYEDALIRRFEHETVQSAGISWPRLAHYSKATWGLLSRGDANKSSEDDPQLLHNPFKVSNGEHAEVSPEASKGSGIRVISIGSASKAKASRQPRKRKTKVKVRKSLSLRNVVSAQSRTAALAKPKRIYSAGAGFRHARDRSKSDADVRSAKSKKIRDSKMISALKYGRHNRSKPKPATRIKMRTELAAARNALRPSSDPAASRQQNAAFIPANTAYYTTSHQPLS